MNNLYYMPCITWLKDSYKKSFHEKIRKRNCLRCYVLLFTSCSHHFKWLLKISMHGLIYLVRQFSTSLDRFQCKIKEEKMFLFIYWYFQQYVVSSLDAFLYIYVQIIGKSSIMFSLSYLVFLLVTYSFFKV